MLLDFQKGNSKSFTLIELMTVVAIVAILSGITLIGFHLFLKQGKIAKSMAFDSSIHFNLGYAIKGDWKMNDNAANSTVVDTSGNNNDGTFVSGGSADNTANHSVDGANGTALEFDGVDDRVYLSYTSGLFAIGSDQTYVTISAWIKPNNISTNQVIYQIGGCNNAAGVGILFNGKVRFSLQRYGTWKTVDSTSILPKDKWTHVLGVNGNPGIYVYINGILENTLGSSVFTWNTGSDGHDIGGVYSRQSNLNDNCSATQMFNGKIDQARIYSEAFSLSQVKYQYYTGLQRLYEKGLMSGKEYKSRIVKLTSES